MSTDYTPSMEEIRESYWAAQDKHLRAARAKAVAPVTERGGE